MTHTAAALLLSHRHECYVFCPIGNWHEANAQRGHIDSPLSLSGISCGELCTFPIGMHDTTCPCANDFIDATGGRPQKGTTQNEVTTLFTITKTITGSKAENKKYKNKRNNNRPSQWAPQCMA